MPCMVAIFNAARSFFRMVPAFVHPAKVRAEGVALSAESMNVSKLLIDQDGAYILYMPHTCQPLSALSVPAIRFFLIFARFSLFSTSSDAHQLMGMLGRFWGIKHSQNLKLHSSLCAPFHQQNKPKFRCNSRKCKSNCALLVVLSASHQLLQSACIETKKKHVHRQPKKENKL